MTSRVWHFTSEGCTWMKNWGTLQTHMVGICHSPISKPCFIIYFSLNGNSNSITSKINTLLYQLKLETEDGDNKLFKKVFNKRYKYSEKWGNHRGRPLLVIRKNTASRHFYIGLTFLAPEATSMFIFIHFMYRCIYCFGGVFFQILHCLTLRLFINFFV